jgi:hypothetical protein
MLHSDIGKMRGARQIKGLDNCNNLLDVKRVIQKHPRSEYERIYSDLKRYRNRKLAIWFDSFILNVLVLVKVGIMRLGSMPFLKEFQHVLICI